MANEKETTNQVEETTTSEETATETAEAVASSSSEEKGGGGPKIKRRNFLLAGAGITTAGLVVGVGYAYENRWHILPKIMHHMANKNFDPSVFIVIPASGKIKLVCHRSEMGQGVRTGLPMILADELGVTLDDIEVVQGLADSRYGSQNTDGSTSVRNFYTRLRTAAAGTRELLELAAAKRWDVSASECKADGGVVTHSRTNKTLTYQELSEDAKQFPFPSHPKLKPEKELKIIGRPHRNLDTPNIVTGQANYGADVTLPGMVYACALRSPVPGATVRSFDPAPVREVRGVLDVFELPSFGHYTQNNAAVAVIAENTWAAMQGVKALKVDWDFGDLKLDTAAEYRKELEQALEGKKDVQRFDGRVPSVEAAAKPEQVVEATYFAPYLVHAPMEPPACIANVTQDGCELWAPTQDPQRALGVLAKLLDMPAEKIKLHVTMLGGGFGRKSQPDFVVEAAALSKKVGKPVRIQWTREDEIKHGFYHAESLQRVKAVVDDKGMPVSWRHSAVYPTILNIMMPGNDTASPIETNMGLLNFPYRVPNYMVEVGKTVPSVRVGWLRSVCNVFQGFAINNFLDELAERAKMDPIEYRLKLLGKPRLMPVRYQDQYPQNTERMITLVNKVRERFGWDKALPKGHGKGFANHYSFDSHAAMACEASVENGVIRLHRVVIGLDCGLAVHPDAVKNQIEGSVVFGMSAALYGKISLQDGVVQQSNFHDYPMVRMNEMPDVDVIIINGAPHQPSGVGEPSVPVVAPAIAAAVYQASGKKLRELPLAEKLV
ncbi:MAG: xanthine dehydrogenase family protein molybdopterin-binding subunit [Deltaproteobacteria bacterium]|nr:MAG: xanthine dehydrogenase family protein molybdopterin-binding subunit [Deltaproteobacteria bacterium]